MLTRAKQGERHGRADDERDIPSPARHGGPPLVPGSCRSVTTAPPRAPFTVADLQERGIDAAIANRRPAMSAPTRRYDLDALRVGAFLLLILYHLGMFYVSWDWHEEQQYPAGAGALMGVLNPRRLSLLFVISGAATRFMSEKGSTGNLAAQRSQRLLIPLAVGMILIVAPQQPGSRGGREERLHRQLPDFWPRYLTFDPAASASSRRPTNHLLVRGLSVGSPWRAGAGGPTGRPSIAPPAGSSAAPAW